MSCVYIYKNKRFSTKKELADFMLGKEQSPNQPSTSVGLPAQPTSEVKPGVSELFESNPELSNAVYEVLGFQKNIEFSKEETGLINDFKNDKNTEVIDINTILNKETDAVTKELIKALIPYLNKNTKIYYQDGYIFKGTSELAIDSSYAATIDGKGNILVFDKNSLNTDVILHELMHDFLLDAINVNKDEILINELTRIFNKAKQDADLVERYSYAFSNLDEFVSEVFGNKGFRQELSYVKDFRLNKTSNIFESVSNAIKDFLKRTFNFEISNTLLDSTFNAVKYTIKNKNQITPQQKLEAQQLYSQYLDTIFPDSKVKDILWHSSKLNKIDKFKKLYTAEENRNQQYDTYGTYFSSNIDYAKGYNEGQLVPILYNSKNLKNIDNYSDFYIIQQEPVSDAYYNKESNEYVVFEPEQIYILGSKQDIEGFKKFVNQPSTSVSRILDIEVQDNIGDHIETKKPTGKQESLFSLKSAVEELYPNWINKKENELSLASEFTYNRSLPESLKKDRIQFGKEAEKGLKKLKNKEKYFKEGTNVDEQIPNMLHAAISGKLALQNISEEDMYIHLFGGKPTPKKVEGLEFTYKGVTIPTKFELGDQQKQALEKSIDYIDSPGKNDFFTIEGSAGTGKTTIVGYVQQYYQAKKDRTKFNYLAPTHAATAQLALTTVELGNKTIPFTVASSFYSFMKDGREVSGFQQKLGISEFGDNVLVVDETSMIEDGTLEKFIALAKERDIRVIFMGDSKQIPSPDPKSTNKDGKKVLNKAFGDDNSVVLTKVYRQNKSDLLTILDGIKESTIMDNNMSVGSDGTISVLAPKDYNKSVIEDFTNDPENVIYIAYTNEAVQKFNKSIKEVVTGQEEIKVGDKIVGYAGKDTKQILNGDIANSIPYMVTEIEREDDFSILSIKAESKLLKGLGEKGVLGLHKFSISKYVQLNETDSIKIENVTQDQMTETNKKVSEKISFMYDKWIELSKQPYSRNKYAEEKQLKTSIETYMGSMDFGNDYYYNPNTKMLDLFPTLKGVNGTLFATKKGLDYGYAITAHKAQGMTIEKAYVDFENIFVKGRSQEIINKKGEVVNTEKNALYYVAMSRAKNNITIKETNNLNVTKSDKLYSSSLEGQVIEALKNSGPKNAAGKSVAKIFSYANGTVFWIGSLGKTPTIPARNAIAKVIRDFNLPLGSLEFVKYTSKSEGFMKNKGDKKMLVKIDLSGHKQQTMQQGILQFGDTETREKLQKVLDNDKSKDFQETNDAIQSDKLHASEPGKVNVDDLFEGIPKTPAKKGISERFKSTMDLALDNRTRLSEKKQKYKRQYKDDTIGLTAQKAARKMFNKAEAEFDAVEQQIKKIRKFTELTETLSGAKAHMQDLKNFFDQDIVSREDLTYAKKLIHAYREAGTIIKGKDHLFLTPMEVNSMLDPDNDYMGTIRKELLDYANEVNAYDHQIKQMEEALLSKTVEEKFGVKQNVTTAEDISGTAASLLDISHSAQPMIQSAAQWYKKQKSKTVQESREINEKINKLYETALKSHSLEKINRLMLQRVSNDDDRKTGNLAMVFSQHFFDSKKNASNKLTKVTKDPDATTANKNKAIKEYVNWLRDNQIFLDPRKLRPRENDNFTQGEIDAHRNFLISTIGKNDFDLYLKQMDKKINEYELDKINAEGEINELELSDAEKAIELDKWEKKHSPYSVASSLLEGSKNIVAGEFTSNVTKYLIEIPASKPEYYDSNYKEIMQDESLRELHGFVKDLLYNMQELMPSHMKNGIQINTLPSISKTLAEQIDMNGLAIPGELKQFMEDSISTTSKEHDIERNPDGTIKKEFYVKYLVNNREEIEARLTIAEIKHNRKESVKLEENRIPWSTVKKEIERNIVNDIAGERSQDIGKAMKLFAQSVLTYKNNVVMEEFVNAVTNTINRQKDASGAELINTKAMWDHFENHFYGGQTRDKEGDTGVKTFSRTEKKKKADIEEELTILKAQLTDGKITEEVFAEQAAPLNEILSKMGSNIHVSSGVDALLAYVQFKNMGWNLPSSVSNVAFGKIAGYIQASSGNYYGMNAYNRASNLGWHSTLKSTTFNQFESDTAKKTRVWMDKLNVLKEARNELFESSSVSNISKAGSMFKWASPYNAQARGEYLVQSIDMNALAIEIEVFKGDEKSTLYDIMNADGTLKPDYTVKGKNGKEFKAEYYMENIYLVKLADVIAENHGNYDTDKPILRKKDAFGRAISQFRTWMFEGANSRFGYSKSKITGEYFTKLYEDEKIVRKGRYRTGVGGFVWNAETSSGLSMFEQNRVSAIATLRLFIPGLSSNKEYLTSKGFTSYDAANISANIMEMNMFLAATAAMLLLKAALPDDEDKNSNSKFVITALINQLNRVQMDLQFYANPTELENLSKNLIPLMSLMEDVGHIGHAAARQFGEHPEYQSGIHEDWNILLHKIGKALPISNAGIKLYDNTAIIFGE